MPDGIGDAKCGKSADELKDYPGEILSAAFRICREGAALVRAEGWEVVAANDGFRHVTGYEQTEVVGRKLEELDFWVNPPEAERLRAALDEKGEVRDFEFSFRRKDKETRQATLSAEMVRLGGRLYVLMIWHDITVRKQAETAAEEADARMRRQHKALTELARLQTLHLEDFDAAMRDIAAASSATLEVERVSVWLYDEEREKIRCYYAVRRGRDDNRITELETADCPPYFYELESVRAIAAHDAATDPRTSGFNEKYLKPLGISSMLDAPIRWHGRTVGVICNEQIGEVREWTMDERQFAASMADLLALALAGRAQREISGQLRESEERFRRLSEATFEAIAIHRDGIILEVNQSFIEMFRCEPDYPIGKSSLEFAAPESRQMLADNIRSGSESPISGFALRKDGEKFAAQLCGKNSNYRGQPARVVAIRDITEQKRAEDALRRSETKYRALIEQASDGIVVLDREGNFVEANSKALEMFGYEQEELLRLNIVDLIPEEDRARYPSRLGEVLAGHSIIFERRVRRKDGSLLLTEISTKLMDDGMVLSIARDITERKRIEETLKSSEAELRALFAAMNDVIISLDSEGRYLKIAPTNPELLYRPSSELLGRRLHEIFPEEQADDYLSWIREALAEQRSVYKDYSLEISGREVWFATTITPMLEDRVVWVARDITRQKEAEESLRRSEQYFRALIENSSDIIAVINPDGTLRFGSPSLMRTFGYEPEEIIGRNIFDFVHPEDVQAAIEGFVDGLSDPRERPVRVLRFRHKDGSWHVMESFATYLVNDPVVAGVIVNARDITERKQLMDQLRQSQKLEAVGRLAGGIAHDFNNVLTIIIGNSGLLLAKVRGDEAVRTKVEGIKKAAQRAASLTQQLLAFSRRQILQPKVIDLNAQLLDTGEMLRQMIREDIELELDLSPDLGFVRADPGQITQVILNLAGNARDAMPGGGRLTIRTENAYLDEDYASSHVGVQPGHFILLTVSDTGEGMDAETQKHIFEPFFTTKEVGKGTGLGLATVYGIVKQSGGSIWVKSQPSEGTTFEIYLPRVNEQAEPLSHEAAPKQLPRGAGRILLVEDDDEVRRVTKDMLEEAGYVVIEAAGPGEALEHCGRGRRDFDLLVTDVVMPQMSGRELAARMLKECPGLRVLYMSGYNADAIAHHGVLDEDVNFIRKPFTAEELLPKVREAMEMPTR